MTAAIVLGHRLDVEGVRVAIRATARTSLVLFALAFSASALLTCGPTPGHAGSGATAVSSVSPSLSRTAFTRWRSWPLPASIRCSSWPTQCRDLHHGRHRLRLHRGHGADPFDRTAAWLGPRAWQALHWVGGYYILISFLFANGKRIGMGQHSTACRSSSCWPSCCCVCWPCAGRQQFGKRCRPWSTPRHRWPSRLYDCPSRSALAEGARWNHRSSPLLGSQRRCLDAPGARGYDIYRDAEHAVLLAILPPVAVAWTDWISAAARAPTCASSRAAAPACTASISPPPSFTTPRKPRQPSRWASPSRWETLALPFEEARFDFVTAFMSLMDMPNQELRLCGRRCCGRVASCSSRFCTCFSPPHRQGPA